MTIPETMRAIAIDEPGGPEVLIPVTEPVPGIGGNDVLVRVMAAGVNRPDVLQRQGLYPVPPDASQLPGLEIAGEVVATGESVSRWSVGDSVMALTHGGGYAEYCRVDEGHCLPVPPKLSLIEAAAVPETFFTVWYNVFMRCRLAEGETFLVHGGSSGIGTTAIQLAKAHGCTVITTAGTNDKCRFCEDLGADKAINYKAGDWQEAVMDYTDGRGVDVLLDMVAGPYMQKNLDSMALEGRYAIIAFLQGPVAELNMRVVLGRRLTITGSTLRPQSVADKSRIADEVRENVLPLLESGEVRPIIDSTFSLNDAAAAHELMESSQHKGKIVLVPAKG
ncbi:MAG: zinc-binding dehydrogenase [Woeseiaceae bacterium]|nr:zinc-binding dehydrogenase [Woeseiaceae bacterium]NIP21067.1 zinc-binding dehydrogenase [Woeseiaceae bacterium]NIS90039.1 zinc-binding dehydrogenase [Woeseiaceae bacterium]